MIYGHKVRARVHPSAFCSWPAEVSPASEALSQVELWLQGVDLLLPITTRYSSPSFTSQRIQDGKAMKRDQRKSCYCDQCFFQTMVGTVRKLNWSCTKCQEFILFLTPAGAAVGDKGMLETDILLSTTCWACALALQSMLGMGISAEHSVPICTLKIPWFSIIVILRMPIWIHLVVFP